MTIRVAWVHSFKPSIIGSGSFMHELHASLSKTDIKPVMIGLGNLSSPLRIPFAFRQLKYETHDFDIIHAQYGSACGFLVSYLEKPKLLTLRGSDWYGYIGDSFLSSIRSNVAPLLTRLSLSRFHRIVTVSNKIKYEVSNNIPKKIICVLPSGIDLNLFRPLDRMQARRRMGYPNDKSPWVLFSSVTKHNPLKRPQLAMEAVKIAKQTIPDIKLMTMTNIPRKDVPSFVAACNVILLTSTHEGWPNVIKEGLACNIPFVSTDVSDLRSIADVENSCYVTEPSPEALAKCLIRSIRDSSRVNLAHYVASMEINLIAEKLNKVYKELYQELVL